MLADFPIVYLIYYTAFTVHLVVVWDMLYIIICVLMFFYKLFRALEATLWCGIVYILPKCDEDMDK